MDFSTFGSALRCDSHPAQYAALRAGLGLGFAQIPLGERDPCLKRILPTVSGAGFPFYVVTHEQMLKTLRVRTVFDILVREMKAYLQGTRSAFPES